MSMNTEQKAKAYDEAIEKLRNAFYNNNSRMCEEYRNATLKIIEPIFPELKESENWIPKEIIKYLKEKGGFRSCWIAWLEKRAEQKTTEKVEPKFKVGDWLVHKDMVGVLCCITQIHAPHYYLTNNNSFIKFGEDDNYRPWTIQDAKDGDVLHSIGFHNDCIFIFNGLDNWKFDEPNGDRAVATGYCCLSVSADNMEFGIQGPDCVEVNTIKPATKTQRDLLFQKMKEAGYEWDAEKKELKEIEQKPAEWSKEDEYLLDETIKHLEALIRITKKQGSAYSNEIQYYQRDIDWLKSLKERVQLQPKQEWSKEDERIKK